jgi:hypothetical protein
MSKYIPQYYHQAADIIMKMAAQVWELQWQNSEWVHCECNQHRTYATDIVEDEYCVDTWKVSVEVGICLDCNPATCEGECDDLSTVNIEVGWAGLSKEDCERICQVIDLDDDKYGEYWFWNSKGDTNG